MSGPLDTTAVVSPDDSVRGSPPEIPGFSIMEYIGGGGFADVYRAREVSLERDVAIKVLNNSSEDTETLARWRAEGQLVARINDDNVVKIHRTGLLVKGSDTHLFFVMEYVNGSSLKSFFATQPQLTRVERLDIFRQIVSGVRAAHAQRIYHRDLKPQNVMASFGDGQCRIRVLDFGIAAFLDGVNRNEIEAGVSPQYAAPEYQREFASRRAALRSSVSVQTERTGDVVIDTPGERQHADARFDVFSLGVVGWQLFRSDFSHPYARPRDADEAEQLVRDAHVATGISDSRLERIIQKATDLDPAKRYIDASQLLDDLDRYANDHVLSMDRRSARRRAATWLRRNRIAVTLGSLLVIGAVGMSGWIDAATDRLAEEQARTAAEILARDEAEARAEAEADRVMIAEESAARQLRQVGFFREALRELGPYRLHGREFTPDILLAAIAAHIDSLDDDPEAQAGILQILGRTASDWGRQDLALDWLKSAETTWIVANDNAQNAESRHRIAREQATNDNMLAWALYKHGDAASKLEASQVAFRAYQRSEAIDGPQHETTLAYRFDAARLQIESGDQGGIDEFFAAMAAIAGESPNAYFRSLTSSAREIASAADRGDRDVAAAELRKALDHVINGRLQRLRGRVPWTLAQAGDQMLRRPHMFYGFLILSARKYGIPIEDLPSVADIRAVGRTAVMEAPVLGRELLADGHIDIVKADRIKEELLGDGSTDP